MMTAAGVRLCLYTTAIVIALVDQFALHGTAFKLTSASHSTYYDGVATGLLVAGLFTYIVGLKR